jgi:anaerobic magnesium-protoporphyrin IX monomethyl ester cyclase
MIALINPNLVMQRNDPFTTGIVYMPVSLAYFAATLRSRGVECRVIDAFGERPNQCRVDGAFLVRGLTPEEVVGRLAPQTEGVVLYAGNLTWHRALIQILKAVRAARPRIPIIVMENTQAVTAYSLRQVQDEFYDQGADYVITGEAEERGLALVEALRSGALPSDAANRDGLGFRNNGNLQYTPPQQQIANLDTLPFPAWDLLPLENYWRLKYAHGPFTTRRYLPLLTSRGCPYPCRFCVIPETNSTRWRARSAQNVVDEMEAYSGKFGVREFHIEDVDPTVNDKRTRAICEEILRRRLDVIWKIAAGTKVETLRDAETVQLMARAGCRYISISPESGSPRLLKLINKPFDIDHAVHLIETMNTVGIRSQACFVLGFPGEERDDLQMTWDLVHRLTKVGVDEIALFVITPVPGSAIFGQFSGFQDYSELNFSPTWRPDYESLNRFRLALYRHFLQWKLRYHPRKMVRQPLNFVLRRFETKMEMTPYRALHAALLGAGLTGDRVTYEN